MEIFQKPHGEFEYLPGDAWELDPFMGFLWWIAWQ